MPQKGDKSKVDLERQQVVKKIDDIIDAMMTRAVLLEITAEKLKRTYEALHPPKRKSKSKQDQEEDRAPPDVFRVQSELTYSWIFGFTDQISKYRHATTHKVQIRHIRLIRNALASLDLIQESAKTPQIDEKPSTWSPFLEYVLNIFEEKINEREQDGSAGGARPTTASSPTQERNLQPQAKPDVVTVATAPLVADVQQEEYAFDEHIEAWIRFRRDAALEAERQKINTAEDLPTSTGRRFRLKPVLFGVAVAAAAGLAGIVTILVLNSNFVETDLASPRIGTPTEEVSTLMKKLPYAKPYSSVVDPQLWNELEPNAVLLKISAPPNEEADSRVSQAFDLKTNAKTAEADKLIQDIIKEWSKTLGDASKAAAKVHRQLGRLSYKKRELERAAAEFQEVLKFDQAAESFNDLGMTLQLQSRLDDAISLYGKAIQADPKFVWAYNNRGVAFTELQPSDTDKALGDFKSALDVDPKFADALSNRGDTYLAQAKYDLAALDYQQVLDVGKVRAQVYNGLGSIAAMRGNVVRAVEYYKQAIELDPNSLPALTNRGISYLHLQKVDDAIADFERALEVVGDSQDAGAGIHLFLGVAYMAALRFDDAAVEFEAVLRSDPSTVAALIALGSSLASMDRLDDAVKILADAYRLDQAAPELYLVRANAQLARGDFAAAFSDFDVFTQFRPNSSKGYLGKGVARLALSDPDARTDLDQAERLGRSPAEITAARLWKCAASRRSDCVTEALYPIESHAKASNPNVVAQLYWWAAQVSSVGLESTRVVDLYNKALMFDECRTRLLVDQGYALEDRKNDEGALHSYEKAVECGDDQISAHLRRGEFYMKRLKWDEAVSDFEKVLAFHPSGRPLALALIDIGHVHVQTDPDQALEDLAKVLPDYDRVLSRQAHRIRANLFARKANYASEVREYDILVGGRPDLWPEDLRNRAIAYRSLGEFANAIADFSTLIKLKPNSATAWNDRADTFFAAGRDEDAVSDYDSATRADPFADFILYNRGRVRETQGKDDLAQADYAASVQKNIMIPDSTLRLFMLHNKRDPAQAGQELDKNLEQVSLSSDWKTVVSAFKGDLSPDMTITRISAEGWWPRYFLAKWLLAQGKVEQGRQIAEGVLGQVDKKDIRYSEVRRTLASLR